MYNIALIAPPGGGKGTQAKKIIEKLKIPHISTGDLFRAILRDDYKGSLPKDEIMGYMKRGELVPDEIVTNMLFERLKEPDCLDGFLLDGFPRTIEQAKAFDEKAADKVLNKVILINVDEDDLIKRLTGRRSCPQCGRIYNIYFSKPAVEGVCDDDGAYLIERQDDNEETVKSRQNIYKKETMPLIDYYKNKGILKEVDGNRSIDVIFNSIMEVIKA